MSTEIQIKPATSGAAISDAVWDTPVLNAEPPAAGPAIATSKSPAPHRYGTPQVPTMNTEPPVDIAAIAPGTLVPAVTRPGFYNPLADEPLYASPSAEFAGENGERTNEPVAVREPRVMLEFFTPTELSSYQVPEGSNLVGDHHIVRGGIFVIGGAPGVGKSRAAVALAVAGATGANWFDLKVHRKFRTMILQAENGRIRLKLELGDLNCALLDEWLLVSAVPPYGFAMTDLDFLAQFRAAILKFKPDIIIIDPWNQCVKDSMEKDYWEGFERLRSCLPVGDDCPALGIVAHTRKPRMGERASGRSLLNLLSGSYVLTSVPPHSIGGIR